MSWVVKGEVFLTFGCDLLQGGFTVGDLNAIRCNEKNDKKKFDVCTLITCTGQSAVSCTGDTTSRDKEPRTDRCKLWRGTKVL